MKFKKFMALGLVAAMTATLFAGCGSKGNDSADTTQKSDSASADGLVSYSDIVLGETGKDLSATITMFNHRTDMDTDDYGGKNWKSYLEDFNKEYPNIKVEITTDTNYADDALTHLQSGQYETITMLPAVGMYLMMASAAPGAIYIGNYLLHAKTPGYRTKLFPSGKPGLVIGLILGSLFLFAAGVLVFLISIVRML